MGDGNIVGHHRHLTGTCKGILQIFGLLLLSELALSEHSVLTKSKYNQLVTSSTLKWVPAQSGFIPNETVVGSVQFVPNGGAESAQNTTQEVRIYVCRDFLNGVWVPGGVTENSNKCSVTLGGRVYQSDNFQTLQNVEKAARLLWIPWDKLVEVPVGAVSGGESFIARRPNPTFKLAKENHPVGVSYLMGKLDPKEGLFGKISVVNQEGKSEGQLGDGQVLVEVEPIAYEITVDRLFWVKRKEAKNKTILGEANLSNEESADMTVDTVITYNWEYTSHWGDVHAMIKGLQTSINFANGTAVESIKWGINARERKNDMLKVESWLPGGTKVTATLLGSVVNVEVPFTGQLISLFADNTVMNRTISGTWQYKTLGDVKLEFGPTYFIRNLTLVPTTTTTTTTTTTQEPTTTTTTEMEPDITQTPSLEKIPSSTVENPSMQMNKQNGNGNKSPSIQAEHKVMFILALLALMVRVPVDA